MADTSARRPDAYLWRYIRSSGPDKHWQVRKAPVEAREPDATWAGIEVEPLFRQPQWQGMDSAPKDGTMIWLVVDYGAYGEHPLADASRCATIGFNNLENTGEDYWQFAGWNWEQDCFCNHERRDIGLPVGWKPIGFDLAQSDY